MAKCIQETDNRKRVKSLFKLDVILFVRLGATWHNIKGQAGDLTSIPSSTSLSWQCDTEKTTNPSGLYFLTCKQGQKDATFPQDHESIRLKETMHIEAHFKLQ